MGKDADRDSRMSAEQFQHKTHREREHVRKAMMAEAQATCVAVRDAYGECARGRTISLPFACRDLFNQYKEAQSQFNSA